MNALLAFWLKLDSWIHVWCLSLVGVFAIVLTRMLLQLSRARRRAKVFSEAITVQAPDESPQDRKLGRSLEAEEQIRARVSELGPSYENLWHQVDQAIETYVSPTRLSTDQDDTARFFLTRPATELVSMLDAANGYSAQLYRTVPGVLTSLGLLGTFVALLVGLNGLEMNGGVVEGLPTLIKGLSGKFLTSIVALGLSVVFLLIEVLYCQPVLRSIRSTIVRAVGSAFPLLTEARILLDIQRLSVKQATALSHISADFIGKFSSMFREDVAPAFAASMSSSVANQLQAELGPTLDALRTTMESLTATVERLEQSKQESVVGEIQGLVGALERTLREALGDMGRQFQEALSGSTKEEFGELANVIQGSASVVGQMNEGLTLVQSTLQSVADSAKQSSSEQMAASFEQTQRLNTLVEGLMVRLNETASQNYDQMSGTLAHVVSALSDRVTKLSDDLVDSVGAATARSQDAATHTLTQATAWSTETREQIAELLATLTEKSDRFDKAGETLVAAQGVLQGTLEHNQRALVALGAAAGEVKAYTSGLAGIQRGVDEGQKAQLQVATLSREAVAKLAEAAVRHEAFLAKYQTTFEEYRGVFEGLDREIGRTLETILERLQGYNRSVEANFKAIVDSANVAMPRMANVLKGSTDELKEHLDELSDVIEKSTARLAPYSKPS